MIIPIEEKPKTTTLKIGDKVKVKNGANTYTGGNLTSFVYQNSYSILEISGNRVGTGVKTTITAAIHKDDLILV